MYGDHTAPKLTHTAQIGSHLSINSFLLYIVILLNDSCLLIMYYTVASFSCCVPQLSPSAYSTLPPFSILPGTDLAAAVRCLKVKLL